jgi:hypothetical protein
MSLQCSFSTPITNTVALASSLGRGSAIDTLRDELSLNVWGPREIVKFALVRELPP